MDQKEIVAFTLAGSSEFWCPPCWYDSTRAWAQENHPEIKVEEITFDQTQDGEAWHCSGCGKPLA
jgi:hypothetical protein